MPDKSTNNNLTLFRPSVKTTKTLRLRKPKIRKGSGLMPTRVHTPKTVYSRKKKFKRNPDATS